MIALKKKKTKIERIVKPEYHTKCSTLLLYNYIKVCVTNDLSWLVIAGKPTKEQLADAWHEITEQYQFLSSEDVSGDYLLNLLIDISTLDERLRVVYNIVNFLFIKRSDELISILQDEYGYPFTYSEESYEADLKATLAYASANKVSLDLAEAELKKYKEANKAPTEFDYDSIVTLLSKYQGYPINEKEVTVTKFISIMNRYKNENTNKSQPSPEETD